MKQFNKQSGFTLIELIIVIIILGILAVTAAPKFLDIQNDAQQSAMSGIAGAIRSASQIAHSANLVNAGTSVTLEGGSYDTVDTYLVADEICRVVGLLDAVSTGTQTSTDGAYTCEYVTSTGATDSGDIHIYPVGWQGPTSTGTPGNCYVTYTDAFATTGDPDTTTAPTITAVTTCTDQGVAP